MINYRPGDVILVNFVFSEGEGVKKRPALIISSEDYHLGRQELIMAAVTSNLDRRLIGDTTVNEWKKAGLVHPSTVTAVIRTIKQNMITHRLGRLTDSDFELVRKNLKTVIEL